MLNLGCGAQTPEGWHNVDYAWGARLARFPGFRLINRRLGIFNLQWQGDIVLHDLRRPLPWPDNSAVAVYCSHTLEHFSRDQGRRLLAEIHRVLGPAGVVRIVVPDLARIVERYCRGDLRSDHFLDALGVLTANGDGSLKERLAPLIKFPHKCMYDQATLLRLLDCHGFDAEPRRHLESIIPGLERLELAGRTEGAVVVEGYKRV